MPPYNWIVEGKLLTSQYPGPGFELSDLARLGVSLIINLDYVPHPADLLISAGIRQIHLPVEDFAPPSRETLDEAMWVIDAAHEDGEVVAIHCRAGLGRSGTVAAAWLVSRGWEAGAAISEVRRRRSGSIETPEQEAAVRAYAASKMS